MRLRRFSNQCCRGSRCASSTDHQRRDKYQRTLAYLYLSDGTFVNREIIRQGFGHAYLTYPFVYAEDFRAAEREAREAERGLWGQSPAKAAQAAPVEPSRVWVNTSSRVYHCPGTRYYGKTARGDYMAEDEAQRVGHRPANGRQCGPVSEGAAETAPAAPPVQPLVAAAQGAPTPATADGKVWVNTSSRVYHCAGTRYYGNTARGEYLSEAAAEAQGHRPAGGRRCGGAAAASPQTAAASQPVARGRRVGTGRPGLGQHELARLPLPGHAVLRHNEERRVPRDSARLTPKGSGPAGGRACS